MAGWQIRPKIEPMMCELKGKTITASNLKICQGKKLWPLMQPSPWFMSSWHTVLKINRTICFMITSKWCRLTRYCRQRNTLNEQSHYSLCHWSFTTRAYNINVRWKSYNLRMLLVVVTNWEIRKAKMTNKPTITRFSSRVRPYLVDPHSWCNDYLSIPPPWISIDKS